ncbi:epoxide hydrolase [Trichoderma arundinaceum]|uniref:Epoxide hydrolase n=1 Tax=Trichoderma arundinaceum TaxID=490622 RepID=A0A395P522_TRIAR|nr:epoxide hydrolase [Trichoderma arundinaceum]
MGDQTDSTKSMIDPYTLHIPQEDIDDLKQRIAQTRWADEEVTDGSFHGIPLSKAKQIAMYWKDEYDWRRFEEEVNRYPQYTTRIDNLNIHFFHVRSNEPGARAILLIHGWPGSFVEFLKCIPFLVDPVSHGGTSDEAFHVIIPSLPGWGFTESPKETGWNKDRTAKTLITLMEERLGYVKWFAQGGDYGAAITTLMAQMRPTGLVAIHLNLLFAIPKSVENPTDEERRALEAFAITQNEMCGWKWISSTRPQTIAYLLSDSAVGQAMWIYEKYQEWTDNSGNAEDALTLDEMLDNISVHWFSRSAGSISRVFWENRNFGFDFGSVKMPVAVLIFEKDIFKHPKKWAMEGYPNMIHFHVTNKGKHFGAFEQPEILVKDIRKGFANL